MPEEVRLTQMANSAGWAAKIGPGVLSDILKRLPRFKDENLLLGFDTSDDACVYKIQDGLAVVQTVDFFPPVVDDPFLYGQIAAANALSDIYAMGGAPAFALNILCFPSCLSTDIVQEILAGGYSKVTEAGAVVAGGHSIDDSVPKYGLCVTGFINPESIWTNAHAQEGDVLILTKPLGNGIINTAVKGGAVGAECLKPALDAMTTLNKYARDAALNVKINACTDITGFGMLGHIYEMAAASGVTIEIISGELPIFPGVEELAKSGFVPGGSLRNWDYIKGSVDIIGSVPTHMRDILCDPQTSGGLLLSLPELEAEKLMTLLKDTTPRAKIVGRVLKREKFAVLVK